MWCSRPYFLSFPFSEVKIPKGRPLRLKWCGSPGSTSDSSSVVAVGFEASKDVGMPLSLNLPGKTEERRAQSRVVLWSSVSCVEVVLKLYHHGSRWSAMEEWEHGWSSFHGSSAKPTETTWKRFIPSCQAHACLWPWRCIHWQLGGPTTTRIWRPGETLHPPWPSMTIHDFHMAGLAGWCALWRYLGTWDELSLWWIFLSWRRNVEVRLPLCRRLEGRQSTWLGQAVGKSVTWHTWEAGPIYWCRRDVSRFTTIVIVDPNLSSPSSPSLSTTGWFFKMMLICSQGEKMREDERRWEK